MRGVCSLNPSVDESVIAASLTNAFDSSSNLVKVPSMFKPDVVRIRTGLFINAHVSLEAEEKLLNIFESNTNSLRIHHTWLGCCLEVIR